MDLIKGAELKIYLKKAEDSFNEGNHNAALKDYLKIVELEFSLKQDAELPLAYRRVADCYHQMKVPLKDEQRSNFKEAVEYYTKAAGKYYEIGEYLHAGDCYENASKISEELGDLIKAAEYSSNSVVLYAKSGDLLSTSHAYLYTARYYEKLGDFGLAAHNFEMAGQLNTKISDDRRAASDYVSAASCYKKIEKFDKAISALANSVNANIKLREYIKIADTYHEMAEDYLKINDFKNSVYYHKKSAELSFESKNFSGAGSSYFKIGEMYEDKKDYETALKNYLQSAEASLGGKEFVPSALAYKKAGDCYQKLGDTMKASEYYVYSAKTSASAGNTQEASKTYDMAGRNFVEYAESKLIDKEYSNAVLYYGKAAECYAGLGDYSKVAEIYLKRAGVHIKAGEEQKAKESYLLAGENYLKAGDGKNAGYNYKLGGDFTKSAKAYIEYASKKSAENDDFRAGEGYKFAARAYAKLGSDSERREGYNKAVWHYNRIIKKKISGIKEELRLSADASEGTGECYLDLCDMHNAERYFQQALDLYRSVGHTLGLDLSSALLDRVKGDIALELGHHTQAISLLKTSLGLLNNLLESGKFDEDFINYLGELRDTVENLIYKIEVKPETELLVDKNAYTFTDTVLLMNGVLTNNGKYPLNIINFLSHLPEEFDLVKLPPNIKELKPGQSVRVSIEVTIKKPGEYVIRPFEIFYKDDKGNKYVKASNESIISVEERPPDDFKNFRLAVDVYLRYANSQLANKNYYYAGDGFKKAAEVYGKFNTDERLLEYYKSAIDAFSEHVKSQPSDMNDIVAVEGLGNAFWNIAESYDAVGDLENAIKNYRETLKYYAKSNTQDKIAIANAFISEMEAKKAIEHGEFSSASEMLSQAIEFFNEALKKGGLNATQLKLIEKHNSEARILIDKIKGIPVILLTVEAPQKVDVGKKFAIKASLVNPGEIALKKIKFMMRFPESFSVENAPSQMLESGPKSSQGILFEAVAKKAGEYKFKPLDMFYSDEKDNNYMRGSNQISITAVERESEAPAGEIAGKPEISVVLEQPPIASKDVKMTLKGLIENKSSMTVNGVRFLVNAPQEFEVSETPEVLSELAEKTKERISVGLIPRKEGDYTFKPIEIFYRDVHGNRFFKSSNEVNIRVQTAVGAREEKPKIRLEKSMTYLLEEDDRSRAVGVFASQVSEGYSGLYITRVNPEQIKGNYGLSQVKFVWLTDVKGDGDYTTTSSLPEISIEIADFISSNAKSVILMEGIEYFVDVSGFTEVVEFIKFQRDRISSKDSKFFVLVNPRTLDPKQIQRLEHECILYGK